MKKPERVIEDSRTGAACLKSRSPQGGLFIPAKDA
jgi:hypothetical protein